MSNNLFISLNYLLYPLPLDDELELDELDEPDELPDDELVLEDELDLAGGE